MKEIKKLVGFFITINIIITCIFILKYTQQTAGRPLVTNAFSSIGTTSENVYIDWTGEISEFFNLIDHEMAEVGIDTDFNNILNDSTESVFNDFDDVKNSSDAFKKLNKYLNIGR